MFKWYVKARYQIDHEERAKALGCDLILEDTSAQVNPNDALPVSYTHLTLPTNREV